MRDLEGARTIRGGASPVAEVRRLRKERDNLKEAVSNTETELMQVCTRVCILELTENLECDVCKRCPPVLNELLMGVVLYTIVVFQGSLKIFELAWKRGYLYMYIRWGNP